MIRSPFCSLRGREFGFEGGFAALVDFQKNNLRALIAGVETPIFHPSDEDPSLHPSDEDLSLGAPSRWEPRPTTLPQKKAEGWGTLTVVPGLRMGHPATCRVM
jgi:hypothetical protein